MIFQIWVFTGFLYSVFLWLKSPEEEVVVKHMGDLAGHLVTAVGVSLCWPLVVYVNHFWKPKDE